MTRGMLASAGLDDRPVKGVYFFAGESALNLHLYTAHPLLAEDKKWNSDPGSHASVMDRIVAAHANTVVMSYWSDMPYWSPMVLPEDPEVAIRSVVEAVQGRPLVIMPAVEGGFDRDHPELSHWELANDFPFASRGGPASPGLVWRIGRLIEMFSGKMDSWARMYDRDGVPRYAVHLIHVRSDAGDTTDEEFAHGFGQVAAAVKKAHQIDVGFTLDVMTLPEGHHATAAATGPYLESEPSVLAIHGFASEVWSGKLKVSPPDDPDNNHGGNLQVLADWKRAALADWVATGIPVILDASNGFDGRFVWHDKGIAWWGDNMSYTDDRWRNWMSELKGPAIAGLTFDCWNGYTEGYAAVPTDEHQTTVYEWLTDLLEPDPRAYRHVHYQHGTRTFTVYGAICAKWLELGGERGFGAPESNEQPSHRGRVSFFANGKAIYWSDATGPHEVHGRIAAAYWEAGADRSCLGLPVTDEQQDGDDHVSVFEHGRIDWRQGDEVALIKCDP